MTEQQPGSPTKTIERICTACGKPVTLTWRKGGNFGARCSHVTDVLGKDGKPTQCGTWIALTPVQSRAIIAKLENEQPDNAEKKTPPADPAPAAGDKPRAERKPKPTDKPADDLSRAAVRSRWALTGWRD